MKTRAISLAVAALLLFAAACHKTGSDEEAIRTAIRQHLEKSGTLNLAAMDTEYQQITVTGDHAQAQVLFKTKQEGASMQMTYALERHNGEWTVLKSNPSGGGMAHPPMDGSHSVPGAAGNADSPGAQLPHFQPPAGSESKPAKPR